MLLVLLGRNYVTLIYFFVFQIIKTIQDTLFSRLCNFSNVVVLITTDKIEGKYGYTNHTKEGEAYSIIISTFQLSELEYLSTLIHEIGHCLTNKKNHDYNWLQTTAYLMTLIREIFPNLTGLDQHQFCASKLGINVTRSNQDGELYFL